MRIQSIRQKVVLEASNDKTAQKSYFENEEP